MISKKPQKPVLMFFSFSIQFPKTAAKILLTKKETVGSSPMQKQVLGAKRGGNPPVGRASACAS